MGAGCSKRSAIGLPGWVEGAIGVLGCGTLFAAPGIAQIVPDNSLGTENSVVTPDATVQGAPADLIEGGAVRGENLFHSFEDFNVNAGQRVYFANPLDIENILSRVTGSNLSNIEGLLGVDGGANLFLLNPNGVIFGPNAELDISGSFTTSTANSFAFIDGSEFSALPTGNELLSVSVPLGVQFNDTPQGDIENSGSLSVGSGETLTLFGNSVLSSGTLTASGGTVQVLGNQVDLVDQATIDVSSNMDGGTALIGGNYQGQGDLPTAQQTQVAPGVQITADNLEVGDGGTVIVWADGITEFAGSVAARGGLQGGNGGFVETSGRQTLIVAPSAQVDARAFQGTGGLWLLDPSDITIDADAATALETSLASGTNVELTTVGGTGGAGDITLASPINANATNNATLSLTASRSIARAENTVININGGNLTLSLNQEVAPTTPTLNNALATIGTVSGNVTVNLGAGTYQEGAQVTLDRGITINGAGAENTVLDGNNTHRVFNIANDSGADVVLSNLTVSQGQSPEGGGIQVTGNTAFTLINSTVRDNVSATIGGGIRVAGNINATIQNSTIANNSATGNGGGIDINTAPPFGDFATTIQNSTISNNSANDAAGGGVSIGTNSTLNVQQSTVTQNNAAQGGGLANVAGGQINIGNSIVAGNDGGDVTSPPSQTGSNFIGGNPLLAPLGDYGGPTQTHALLPESSAINAAGADAIPTDQRGVPAAGVRDIGAYEFLDSLQVNTSADELDNDFSLSDLSLREAIAFIGIEGVIGFDPNLSEDTITLDLGQLEIDRSLTIQGDLGSENITVTGNNASRVFHVTNGLVVLDGLSITGGNTTESGGGIRVEGAATNFTLTNSTVFNNSASPVGGGIAIAGGANVTIANSTISGNSGAGNAGGVDINSSTVNVENSTISGNTSGVGGGGFSLANSTLNIDQSTITQNMALSGGGISSIYGSPPVVLRNTIVAGNSATTDGTENINGLIQNAANNLVGGDPFLASLEDNGGPTQTHALLSGSPAIDAAGAGATTIDQRGFPATGIRDIGAYEFTGSLWVDTSVDELDSDFSPGDFSLREAIEFVGIEGTISFDPNLSGDTITLGLGELEINRDLTINGLGDDNLAISGDNDSRVFNIAGDGTDVIIRDLSITEGSADFGGAILVSSGSTLTIENSTLTDNVAELDGGGIDNSGTVTLTGSTLTDNTAMDDGGGIDNDGTLTITDSIISGNTAEGGNGGGIINDGNLTITNSTVNNNSADDYGGGISSVGSLVVENTTLSDNSADIGAGIYGAGTLQLTNITSDDLETAAEGTTNLNGTIATTGNQIYRNGIAANADLSLIGDDISILDALNVPGNLRIEGDDIQFAGAVDVDGALNVTATETVTQTEGSLSVDGTTDIRTSLDNAGNVNIGSSTALNFTSALVGGNLAINAPDVAGVGLVAGETTINGVSGANPLGVAAEPVVIQDGDSYTVTSSSDTDLSTLEGLPNVIPGNLQVTAVAGEEFVDDPFDAPAIMLPQSDNAFAGNLVIATDIPETTGTIPQITQSAALEVGGVLTANATTIGNVRLDDPGNSISEWAVIGEDVFLRTTGDARLNDSTVTGDLVVTAGGSITDNGDLNVAETATFNAGNNPITLDSANNQFGTLEFTGSNVEVEENSATDLGNSSISGTLTVNASGDITDSGDVRAAGITTLNAGTNDITLNSSDNQFGTLRLTGNTVAIRENDAATLGAATNVTGDLSITATDIESINSGLQVDGDIILQPYEDEQTINIGSDADAGFSLTQTEINSLNAIPGLDSVTIGSDSGSGSVNWTLDTATDPSMSDPFEDPLTLRSPSGSVNIDAPSTLSLSDVTVEANNIAVTAIGDITLTNTQLLGQSDSGDVSTIEIDTGLDTSDRRDLFLVGDSQIEAIDGVATLLTDNIDATNGTNSDIIAGTVIIRSTFSQELINIFEQTAATAGNDIISTGFLQDPSGFDPSEGANELPADLEDASDRIQTGCGLGNTNKQSEFVITGRGGLPPGPSNLNTANRVEVPWVTEDDTSAAVAVSPPAAAETPLVEAQSIQVDENGNIYFVTDDDASTSQSSSFLQSRQCTEIPQY